MPPVGRFKLQNNNFSTDKQLRRGATSVASEVWRRTAIRLRWEAACSMLTDGQPQMRVGHTCCYAEESPTWSHMKNEDLVYVMPVRMALRDQLGTMKPVHFELWKQVWPSWARSAQLTRATWYHRGRSINEDLKAFDKVFGEYRCTLYRTLQ